MIPLPSNMGCPRCKGEMQYFILTSIPPQFKAKCLYCGYEEGPNVRSTQTNADRIRAMTDEELAELWWERVDCGECPVHKECKLTGQDCKQLALDWLKQEVEESPVITKETDREQKE